MWDLSEVCKMLPAVLYVSRNIQSSWCLFGVWVFLSARFWESFFGIQPQKALVLGSLLPFFLLLSKKMFP